MAQRIRMTAMPQMVALLNGFGGIASAIGGGCRAREARVGTTLAEPHSARAAVFDLGGAVRANGRGPFWGSLIAYVKLEELIGWKTIARMRACLAPTIRDDVPIARPGWPPTSPTRPSRSFIGC